MPKTKSILKTFP